MWNAPFDTSLSLLRARYFLLCGLESVRSTLPPIPSIYPDPDKPTVPLLTDGVVNMGKGRPRNASDGDSVEMMIWSMADCQAWASFMPN